MIPVFMLKNGDMYKVFEGIQAAFRYLRELDTQQSDNAIYEIINNGLDNHMP